jgi:hypothetical protein
MVTIAVQLKQGDETTPFSLDVSPDDPGAIAAMRAIKAQVQAQIAARTDPPEVHVDFTGDDAEVLAARRLWMWA